MPQIWIPWIPAALSSCPVPVALLVVKQCWKKLKQIVKESLPPKPTVLLRKQPCVTGGKVQAGEEDERELSFYQFNEFFPQQIWTRLNMISGFS